MEYDLGWLTVELEDLSEQPDPVREGGAQLSVQVATILEESEETFRVIGPDAEPALV